MQNEEFSGIVILTRVGGHLWKYFCESVERKDEMDIRTFDAALETVAATKKFLEFDEKFLERRHRRFRAALLLNARRLSWVMEGRLSAV